MAYIPAHQIFNPRAALPAPPPAADSADSAAEAPSADAPSEGGALPPRDGEVAARKADGGGSPHAAPFDAENPLHHPADGPPPRAGEEPEERIGTAEWTVLTPERQATFLDQLTAHGGVRLAARAAGVSRQTAYRLRAKSAAFALAWDAARLAARPMAEDALACRAVDGWEEPVFYRGEKIDSRRRYCSRLLLAHLARLDKLAERAEVHAALPLLDEAIGSLREGRDLDGTMEAAAAREGRGEAGGEEGNSPLDRVPGVPSSSAEPAPCRECGGRCEGPEAALTAADCRWFGNRLERMYAARPREAPAPRQLASLGIDADEIEMIQLEAFECGLEGWWELASQADLDGALALRAGEIEWREDGAEGESEGGGEGA